NAALKVARALGASQLVSTAGSPAKEAAAAADGGLREVGIVSLQRESLADGLARLAPGGVDVVIDALGGPFTGQAVGGLARGGRLVVMGYSAGIETTMRVTDLVWKLAHVSGFSLFAASAGEQPGRGRWFFPPVLYPVRFSANARGPSSASSLRAS